MKTTHRMAVTVLGLAVVASAAASDFHHVAPQATSLLRNDGGSSIALSLVSTFEGHIETPDTIICDDRGGVDEAVVKGGAEIVTYDRNTRRVFITHDEVKEIECNNGYEFEESVFRGIDIVDIRFPAYPRLIKRVDTSDFGRPTSVAVCRHHNFFAAAIAADPLFQPGPSGALEAVNGVVAFYHKRSGRLLNVVEVGALPDMITCTPDGDTLLVANEGEPERGNYDPDPEGSVSIIDVTRGARRATVLTANFEAFNTQKDELIEQGVRIYGPSATVAQDLEPEYIAVSDDSAYAYITLQENNAIAKLDIHEAEITDIFPLDYKNHALLLAPKDSPSGKAIRNGLDPSDLDGGRIIRPMPVSGMYQPDAIASFTTGGETYVITANQGDSRDYDGYSEEIRIKDWGNDGRPPLCDGLFPEIIQDNDQLGRLKTTSAPPRGIDPMDNCVTELFSYGGRSLTIWDTNGNQVYDTGDDFEQITGTLFADNFNSQDNNDTFDDRSDDKGPEPEGITTGVVNGQTYAFALLIRIGGVIVYNVTDPKAPKFVQYINNRDFDGNGDLSPEGIVFVSADDSPGAFPFIAIAHEETGTTSFYRITPINGFDW